MLQAANKRRELRKDGGSRPGDAIPITDSTGVMVLSAAQDYARATRLAIQIRHARIESFVRREASVADLAVVIDAIGWEPLDVPGEQSRLELSLANLRNRYRLLLEALIWARLYGFSASNPVILVNNPEQPFKDVTKNSRSIGGAGSRTWRMSTPRRGVAKRSCPAQSRMPSGSASTSRRSRPNSRRSGSGRANSASQFHAAAAERCRPKSTIIHDDLPSTHRADVQAPSPG